MGPTRPRARRLPAAPILSLALACPVVAQKLPELALRGLDPVELCGGKEVTGGEDVTAASRRYLYRFSSAANRERFEKDPARYEIQLGGGCGRMGPLSGVGDPTRFAVHDGRIYIFASDSCRRGFLADPAAHLEIEDPIATGTDVEASAAAAILAHAVEAIGGARRLDALTTIHFRDEQEQEYQGRKVPTGTALLLGRDVEVSSDSWWDAWHVRYRCAKGSSSVLQRTDAKDRGTEWPLAPSQVLALRKLALHEPVQVLRMRNRPGFVAFARRGEGDAATEDRVAVSFVGVTVELSVERRTGRITGCRYRGRLGTGPNGDVVLGFSDFRDVDGLKLPFTRTASFGNKEAATRRWSRITVDDAADADTFTK